MEYDESDRGASVGRRIARCSVTDDGGCVELSDEGFRSERIALRANNRRALSRRMDEQLTDCSFDICLSSPPIF